MHQQAQLRLKKDEAEKLGARRMSCWPWIVTAKVVKEENLVLPTFEGPFSKEKSLVFATALSDPAGSASALYGVSRRCVRWGSWVENHPSWFVIDRRGILTYAAQ